jgi:hypothetical protein
MRMMISKYKGAFADFVQAFKLDYCRLESAGEDMSVLVPNDKRGAFAAAALPR